jgi:hypothetical protein
MEDGGDSGKISHSQVITSTLVTVGYPETLDRDLDFCGDVLDRAVAKMKRHEQSVNFNDVTEKERLRAIFVLNTMYEVEKKLKAQQAQEQHTAAHAAGNASLHNASGMHNNSTPGGW